MSDVLDKPAEQREVVGGKTLRNFDLLSEDSGLNDNYKGSQEQKKAEEKEIEQNKEVTKTDEEKAAELLEKPGDNPAEEAKPEESEENKGDEKPEETVEEEEGFTKPEQAETSENGWKEYAKARGYGDITEDSEEAFQKAEQEHWQKKEEELRNEITEEKVLSKYSPEVRAHIELLNSGMSLEEVQAPFKNLERFKSMTGSELVRSAMKLDHPTWTDEILDKEMEYKTEDQIKHEEQKIRLHLEEAETNLKNDLSNRVEKYRAQAQEVQRAQKEKELSSIKSSLDKVSDFLGKKVTEADKNYMYNKLANGYLETLRSNPEKLIKAAMFDDWGDKAISYHKAQVQAEITKKNAQKQHNVPPTDKSVANRVVTKDPGNGKVDPLAGFKDFANW